MGGPKYAALEGRALELRRALSSAWPNPENGRALLGGGRAPATIAAIARAGWQRVNRNQDLALPEGASFRQHRRPPPRALQEGRRPSGDRRVRQTVNPFQGLRAIARGLAAPAPFALRQARACL